MKSSRMIFDSAEKSMIYGKAVLLPGPRRVGKTVLLQDIAEQTNLVFSLLDGDDPQVRDFMESAGGVLIGTSGKLSGLDDI